MSMDAEQAWISTSPSSFAIRNVSLQWDWPAAAEVPAARGAWCRGGGAPRGWACVGGGGGGGWWRGGAGGGGGGPRGGGGRGARAGGAGGGAARGPSRGR